ncbi:DUF6341 family protein [Nonlabens xiamenensis]|uniref:DUF6341 family protein n=1 Tax=Nonlabens xiamenensis TaxID=2341043 RepID=UPI000F60D178|nr:uracil phosphoribosyltransferase [Nonlabens xiamenensis]
MESLIEGIAYLFEEILMVPFEWLRELELESWWLANTVTWIAILVLCIAVLYWMKQLKAYDAEEDKTQTGHSFLG